MEAREPLIRIEGLKKYFPVTRGVVISRKIADVKAVDDVSFTVFKGETLGLVGESGCGKSTTGRTIVQLYRPTAGRILYRDADLAGLSRKQMVRMRTRLQMIFQDPYASFNPRMTVGKIISEAMEYHRIVPKQQVGSRTEELLGLVGLKSHFVRQFPHEFSGGQRQRIGIARALAMNPEFIVCDEPISALDVSIQAQVVNLLGRLQEKLDLTYLFIAHDLSMVRHISDRVAVMYLGKIVELTDKREIYRSPQHPYTQALLSAVPIPDPDIESRRERIVLKGDVPSPSSPPVGCNFNTRCPKVMPICREQEPEFREIAPGHFCACHLHA